MELDDSSKHVVDPEVRAHVYSLVSALGGTGADEDGRYLLGDDALGCLKDLKRWLKLYDEKSNRLDVARCLAEANLVNGDLLEILAAWPEEATEDRLKAKIALACLELLVPLTWPLEKEDIQITVNHYRHIPYLQLAQISYKRGILEHESMSILRTAVRVGLPAIALPRAERSSRDEGIIKLLLYFFRNVAIISHQKQSPVDWNEDEVSRSATIGAFHQQDVFALLLTIASNMGDDFNTQDVVLLEVLFHLFKGVNVEDLFMEKAQLGARKSDELKSLLAKESGMHRDYARNAPTRHNRFGTMIWLKQDDAKVSTVSGQDVLKDYRHTLAKMDQTKKWNKPRRRNHVERTHNDFDVPVSLSTSASKHLRAFVEEFLDSGFNPLFNHLRRAIEREAERVLEIHTQQFFYLVSWFLEAERVRRKWKKDADQKSTTSMDELFEPDSYGLVATVLNQETFILLNRFMQDRLDNKSWQEVSAGMRCFTQILLTVQEMSESPLEEDQEIAENIQNRIFYEESTHDRIVSILRGYKDQGFGYLDTCTELTHVFLRVLERYSKDNVDMQVRSRRRARKKKRAETGRAEKIDETIDQDSEAEEIAEAQRLTKERKFDFTRFSAKFVTQPCVDSFVSFTHFFRDLKADQLKRAHRFFYRVAFKQERSIILFRLDIIALFNKMIQGPEGLDKASPLFKEWEELVRQLFRRLTKKLQQRPELFVELLFSKINATAFYLEYGYEKQTHSSNPRAPAELQIKGAMSREDQIGVAVAVLHEEKLDAVDWVKGVLALAADERQSWETEAAARRSQGEDPEDLRAPSITVNPDNEERRIAMFKDNKLRLLMTLVGLERLGVEDEPNATWIIPSSIGSTSLRETHDIIEKHRNDPVMQYGDEDPVSAEEMLQRKSAAQRRRAEYDDDSEGDGLAINIEEDFLFPAGGPTNRKSDALTELKQKRRRRRVAGSDEEGEIDEASLAARRKARQQADLEKRRKIKSDYLVHDSDDETDEERDHAFFAKEAQTRKEHLSNVLEALASSKGHEKDSEGAMTSKKRRIPANKSSKAKRRKSSSVSAGSDADRLFISAESSSPARRQTFDTSDEGDSETPLSSPHLFASSQRDDLEMVPLPVAPTTTKPPQERDESPLETKDDDDDDEEEVLPVTSKERRRARGVMIDDSDSE